VTKASPALLVVDSLHGLVQATPVAPHVLSPQPLATSVSAVLDRLSEWQRDFARGQSASTVRAVRGDWSQYIAWCEGTGSSPLPATVEQLEAFLENAIIRGRKRATINRYLYTVGLVHDAAGLPNPVKDTRWGNKWKALVRELGERCANDSRQAGELVGRDIQRILLTLGNSARDLRDAAMLSLASDTLLRESELVAVRIEHFAPVGQDGAYSLRVPFSKANQEGKDGDYRYVDATTMSRIRAWQSVAGITRGFLFRPIGGRPKTAPVGALVGAYDGLPLGRQEVARIFRRRALAAGLDHAGTISGHSMRIGTANDLINAGYTTAQIQHAGGWNSPVMVHRYTRRSMAGQNAVAGLRKQQRKADRVDPAPSHTLRSDAADGDADHQA